MTHRSLGVVVVLALALVAGAWERSHNPAAPGQTEPKLSTVSKMDLIPSSTVAVGGGITFVEVMNTNEAGITREVTFVVTLPDGSQKALPAVTSVSRIAGCWRVSVGATRQ